MPTIEITSGSANRGDNWSRRSLIRTGLAGLLVPAAVALSIPVRRQDSTNDLLRGAYHSIEDARVIGRSYLEAVPREADLEILAEALFGANIPTSRRELRSRLAAQRDADFGSGRVLAVRGWLMAVTEARWCALAVFLSESA